jgi:hypothetical protein
MISTPDPVFFVTQTDFRDWLQINLSSGSAAGRKVR